MEWNFEGYRPEHRPMFSPALMRRTQYIQRHADELFLLDDFLARIRQDFVSLVAASAQESDVGYCRVMQQSWVRFVSDFAAGYQEPLAEVQSICRQAAGGGDCRPLERLRWWRDRLLERYAAQDLTDWLGDLRARPDEWAALAARLYEASPLAAPCGEAGQLVRLVGTVGCLTSILTGHADRFGLHVDYDAEGVLPSAAAAGVDDGAGDAGATDELFFEVIATLCREGVLRKMGDWGLVMTASNQTDRLPDFATPASFVQSLAAAPLDGVELPSESSVSKMVRKMRGMFPQWTFTDTSDRMETNRRINVGRRLIAAARQAGLL